MKSARTELGTLIQLREKSRHRECIVKISALFESKEIKGKLRRSLLGLRSDCFLDLEQWVEAVSDLTDLLRDKEESPILANRGLAWWSLGNHKKALLDFRHALLLNPSDAVTHRNIGRLQIERGQIRSGLWHIRRSIAVCPKEPFGYVLLGDVLAEQNDWLGAYRAYVSARKLDPAHKHALQQIKKIEQVVNDRSADE